MAEQSLAYEDAAKWFERAASLPELSLGDRAKMNLGAAANHVRAGDFSRARAIYERISAMDDPLIRLEAAVGYEDANWRRWGADSKAADLLASALESCGLNSDDSRYVQALGSFGRALAFAGESVACSRNRQQRHRTRAGRAGSSGYAAHSDDEPLARSHPGAVRNPIGAFSRGLADGAERAATTSRWGRPRTSAPWSAMWRAGPPGRAASAADMQRAAQACGQPVFGFVGACVEQALAYLRGDFAGAERWAISHCARVISSAETTSRAHTGSRCS